MLRLLKSSGINSLAIQDVNACGLDTATLESPIIANVTANLGPIFERFGVKPFWTVCFGAPTVLANLSSDPQDPRTRRWWEDKVNELYSHLPGLGGLLVKADSEGNVGPLTFNRTENVGANMLARALKPHNGTVLWRSFVYGAPNEPGHVGTEDLARQSFDTFFPLDGQFDENVILQIKNGPIDFQIREPLHPLLGAMKHTNVMMEVQATQEYTGQGIHAVSLTEMWAHYLRFDTQWAHLNGSSTIAQVLTRPSNTFGCGRLGWDPTLTADAIHREWAQLTFPTTPSSSARAVVTDTVASILQRSWGAYEGYSSPLGIGFMIGQNNPFGCAPRTGGPGLGPNGGRGAGTDHYWMDPCPSFDFQNASYDGLGCDRSPQGTGYASLYSPAVSRMLNDAATCPRELLLFFHHLNWDHPMSWGGGKVGNGTVSLFEFIRQTHGAAVQEVGEMARDWDSLEGMVDEGRFKAVQARFLQQANDARVFSDVVTGYYANVSRRGRAGRRRET
eukprot:g2178.t1